MNELEPERNFGLGSSRGGGEFWKLEFAYRPMSKDGKEGERTWVCEGLIGECEPTVGKWDVGLGVCGTECVW